MLILRNGELGGPLRSDATNTFEDVEVNTSFVSRQRDEGGPNEDVDDWIGDIAGEGGIFDFSGESRFAARTATMSKSALFKPGFWDKAVPITFLSAHKDPVGIETSILVPRYSLRPPLESLARRTASTGFLDFLIQN